VRAGGGAREADFLGGVEAYVGEGAVDDAEVEGELAGGALALRTDARAEELQGGLVVRVGPPADCQQVALAHTTCEALGCGERHELLVLKRDGARVGAQPAPAHNFMAGVQDPTRVEESSRDDRKRNPSWRSRLATPILPPAHHSPKSQHDPTHMISPCSQALERSVAWWVTRDSFPPTYNFPGMGIDSTCESATCNDGI
jgi:hypothetical protein